VRAARRLTPSATMALLLCLVCACAAQPRRDAPHDGAPQSQAWFSQSLDSLFFVHASGRRGVALLLDTEQVLCRAHLLEQSYHIALQPLRGGPPIAAVITALDPANDLALLRPLAALPAYMEALAVPAIAPHASDLLWALGHPARGTYSLAAGRFDPHSDSHPAAALPPRAGFTQGILVSPSEDGRPALRGLFGPGPDGNPSTLTPPALSAAIERLADPTPRPTLSAAQRLIQAQRWRPQVHFAAIARADASDHFDLPSDPFHLPRIPGMLHLPAQVVWRYGEPGDYHFRLKVVHLSPERGPRTLFVGQRQRFHLAHPQASHIHYAELSVPIGAAGHFLLLTETNDQVTAVAPFFVADPDTPQRRERFPFARHPSHCFGYVAEHITHWPASLDTSAFTRVRRPFNTIVAPSFPHTSHFATLIGWRSDDGAGQPYVITVVDPQGEVLAQREGHLDGAAAVLTDHRAVHTWDITWPAPGRYAVIATSGEETALVLPIWIAAEPNQEQQ